METPNTDTDTTRNTEALTAGQAVKLKPLRDGLKELETAYELARASRAALKEKIVAVSEKSGLTPGVIRAFLAARMAEDAEKSERKAEQARQLSMVFEEIGA